jgi:predicted choloylglycine hydrolase
MIGRFIIECDPQYFDLAKDAIEFLQEHPEHSSTMISQTDGHGNFHASVFANRNKKSIRVRQVKP